jgi:hypothetical protein
MPHAKRPTLGRYGRTWHDGKAPDGFRVNGWRRVTKGGYVRFCHDTHYHEKFSQWAGLWVFVELDDCYGINVNVWPDEPWAAPRTVMYCANKRDWFSEDSEAAQMKSRRRPTRSCN